MPSELQNKRFNEFDAQYHQWYDKYEKADGLMERVLVRYVGINKKNDACIEHRQYCGFPSDRRSILTLHTIYEVEYRILARSWQLVKLVGFPYEVEFSPHIFEVIDKNTESKPLRVGGRLLYIGLEDTILTSGNFYVVEGLFLHYHGYGFVSVKLIGNEEIFDRRLFERVLS